jgi:hypothetical protein
VIDAPIVLDNPFEIAGGLPMIKATESPKQ